jgi:hypothetical protein
MRFACRAQRCGSRLRSPSSASSAPAGLIYTRVTVPLDVSLDETPVHTDRASESWNTFQYYVQVDWGSDAPGDIAKQYGFTRVYYADLEVLSVLGIWTQRWAHVYGERAPLPSP